MLQKAIIFNEQLLNSCMFTEVVQYFIGSFRRENWSRKAFYITSAII